MSMIMILIFAMPAFAVFSSKGQIPNGAPVEYRGLKVTSDGVNITLVNKGEGPVRFSAACCSSGLNSQQFWQLVAYNHHPRTGALIRKPAETSIGEVVASKVF